MQVESVPIEQLNFDPANARVHDNKNLDSIKGSLTRFGQQTPIVVDEKNLVLKGNGTLAAARALGWKNIFCVRSDLNTIQKTAYAIADNRTGELAKWDNDVLAKTLLALRDEDFALADIGFDDLDLKKILGEDLPREDGENEKEFKNQFGVIVMCSNEDEQQTIFESLTAEGYECKVVVT